MVPDIDGKRIARDAVIRIGARVVGSMLLGITLLLLAHELSVGDFGRLILAYTLGMAVGLVAGLGASTRVMRVQALTDPHGVASRTFILHSVSTLGVFSVCLGAIVAVDMSPMVIAGAAFAFSDTVQNYAQAHLAGLGAHTASSVLGVVQRAVPLAAVAGASALGHSVAWVLTAAVGATAVLALSAPVRSALEGRGRSSGGIRKGYWMLSVSGALGQLQVPAFALFAAATTVGWFSLATRVTGPLTLLAAALSTVLIPELSRLIDRPSAFSHVFRRYVALACAYLIVVAVAALPAAKVVIQLVGDKYAPAESMLAGLMIAAGLSSVSQAVSSAYIARGRPARVTVAIVVGGCVILALLMACGYNDLTTWVWAVPVVGQLVVLVILLEGLRARSFRIGRVRGPAAVVVVGVLAATVLAVGGIAGQRPAAVTGAVPATMPVMPFEASAVRILLIGDSLTEGTGFGGRGDSNWTRIAQAELSRRSPVSCPVLLRVDARGGAGYLAEGIRGTTFLTQIKQLMTPDIGMILISGSNNDAELAKDDVSAYRRQVRSALDAAIAVNPRVHVVVVSSLLLPGRVVPAGTRTAKQVLAQATQQVGGVYIDPNSLHWFDGVRSSDVLGGDGQHPTDVGHRRIAAGMTPIIASEAKKVRCTA